MKYLKTTHINRYILLISITTIFALLTATATYVFLFRMRQRVAPYSNEIVVYTKPGITEGQVRSIAAAVHADYVKSASLPWGPAFILNIPWAKSASDTQNVVQALILYPEVRNAEMNAVITSNKLFESVGTKP